MRRSQRTCGVADTPTAAANIGFSNAAMKKLFLIGRRFGRLIVIAEGPRKGKHKHRTSICRCDCGNECIALNAFLTFGKRVSCGCLCRKSRLTHGHNLNGQKTHIYSVWDGMMQRCTNPNHQSFKYYQKRGICERWMTFENFVADMGPGKVGWTIHRIDNDKGYFLENCVWATPEFQMRHTSRTRIYTVRGYTGCLKDLCKRFGVMYQTIRYRLANGDSIEEAIFRPLYNRPGYSVVGSRCERRTSRIAPTVKGLASTPT
jgi:hypothetical protein